MDKDEMKNKISMALKDPILQQGFEIICKHLEEKDKEIKDLEWQLKEVIEDNDSYQKDNTEKDKQIEGLNNFIDEQRTTIARQIVELTEKENDKKGLLGIIQGKDEAIKKLIADMAGLEEELTEKDRQIGELKNDMATAIPLLEKAECTSCIYTDSPCVRGDYPMKDGHCTHHKHFGDEITVLKVQNEQLTLKLDAIKWHKVADGDLPKEMGLLMSKTLLLITKMKGSDCLSLALGQYNFSTQEFSYQHIVGLTEVYAWKEIVLPELPNWKKY